MANLLGVKSTKGAAREIKKKKLAECALAIARLLFAIVRMENRARGKMAPRYSEDEACYSEGGAASAVLSGLLNEI